MWRKVLNATAFGITMAYLEAEEAIIGNELEIPLLETRRKATVIADSPYDPGNARARM